MDLRVEIVSRETIKPSSPTPVGLRNYKLSFLDQLAARLYVPIVLFYSTGDQKYQKGSLSHDHLKKSLSLTLTQMYPLAGRLKDQFLIECNDQGADYIHARVEEDISRVLQHPEIDLLKMLLPYNPHLKFPTSGEDQVLLSVQLNEFSCGGIAIGVCIRHVIADAATTATFFKTWATNNITTSTNNTNVVDNFVFDCTSIFPPQDMAIDLSTSISNNKQVMRKAVTKRFVFSGTNIAALREKANMLDDHEKNHPTRVEAVVAFIWAAVISTAQARNMSVKAHDIVLTVNLRNRMVPPIPPHSMGNFFHITRARWEASDGYEGGAIDYQSLVQKTADSIQLMKDGYVRKNFANGAYFKAIRDRLKLISNKSEEVGNFAVSSWCRFPFYEVDFGWGKPVLVGNCLNYINSAVLMDTSDGKGMEAWIGLSEGDMDKLEQNTEFLSYCSLSQTA